LPDGADGLKLPGDNARRTFYSPSAPGPWSGRRSSRRSMFAACRGGDESVVAISSDPFADHPLPSEPIVHCPLCGSGLIYPVGCCHDGQATEIECRCPECEHTEVMLTSPIVAAVWRLRDARIAEAMSALADVLADERAP
jgi:hypothetical protein